MNKMLQVILTVFVAFAAYYGVKYMRNKAVTQGASAKLETLKEEAAKKYPDMAKTDALKAVAQADSVRQLNAISSVEGKRKSAAYVFFGFYYMNTKARVAYCKQRGTDLTPFTTAFAVKNQAEHARAYEALNKADVQPESMVPLLSEQFASVVEQDMKDVAMGAQIPLEKTCAFFNDNAELIAQEIKLAPEVRAALMAN